MLCWAANMSRLRAVLGVLTFTALPALSALAAPPASVPYSWKSVQIVGGGFVDGFVFHPTAKDVLYARTDIGGAYRRDAKTHRWEPHARLGSVRRSQPDGRREHRRRSRRIPARSTWRAARTRRPRSLTAPSCARPIRGTRSSAPTCRSSLAATRPGRGNGERMAVDPNDGRILFLGTRHAGLWKSTDGAVTWSKVATFPGRRAEAAARRGQAAGLERRRAQQHRLRRLRSGERRPGEARARRSTRACR